MELIEKYIDMLEERYEFDERFKLSLNYYFDAKIRIMVKNKIIEKEGFEDILKIWINNFLLNVDEIKQNGNYKYTWVSYSKKIITACIGKEANIDKESKNVSKNIVTTQYMYRLFKILETVTNYNISRINRENIEKYEEINKFLATKYVNNIPKIEKRELSKKYNDLYFDTCSFDSVVDISTNYIDIVVSYIIGYKNIYLSFIKNNINALLSMSYISDILYLSVLIHLELEYDKYVENNKKVSDLILEYILNNIKKSMPLDSYTSLYYKDAIKNIEEKLPYRIVNGKRVSISDKEIKNIKDII